MCECSQSVCLLSAASVCYFWQVYGYYRSVATSFEAPRADARIRRYYMCHEAYDASVVRADTTRSYCATSQRGQMRLYDCSWHKGIFGTLIQKLRHLSIIRVSELTQVVRMRIGNYAYDLGRLHRSTALLAPCQRWCWQCQTRLYSVQAYRICVGVSTRFTKRMAKWITKAKCYSATRTRERLVLLLGLAIPWFSFVPMNYAICSLAIRNDLEKLGYSCFRSQFGVFM